MVNNLNNDSNMNVGSLIENVSKQIKIFREMLVNHSWHRVINES